MVTTNQGLSERFHNLSSYFRVVTLECCDVFVLRPEISVLSGTGVHHHMLKGGTNYSWTVILKGCVILYS